MRFCLWPGCSARVQAGYCQAHGRRSEAVRRGTARERLYTHRWDEASTAFRREFPLCGMRPGGVAPVMSRCWSDGMVTPAALVDHVVPHRGDARLFWDRENWQSLCAECHAAKTRAGS